jgi:hypothetical protein
MISVEACAIYETDVFYIHMIVVEVRSTAGLRLLAEDYAECESGSTRLTICQTCILSQTRTGGSRPIAMNK